MINVIQFSGRHQQQQTSVPYGIIRQLYGPPQQRRRFRHRRIPDPIESLAEQTVAEQQKRALEKRRHVYRNGLFVKHMGANRISGFQQITPDTFKVFPQKIDRLIPWIRRDLQAIITINTPAQTSTSNITASSSSSSTSTSTNDTESILQESNGPLELIRAYIVGVMKLYDLQTDRAQDLLRDFLRDHTEHFVHELIAIVCVH
ncbi:hypothetical protein BGZ76_009511 [Entomortierella beljakovae]|nr:hypothetical protein BGZ76_009511 [Entomortierella beljakovae]